MGGWVLEELEELELKQALQFSFGLGLCKKKTPKKKLRVECQLLSIENKGYKKGFFDVKLQPLL